MNLYLLIKIIDTILAYMLQSLGFGFVPNLPQQITAWAIRHSKLQIVRSVFLLVTYLDVGNFCNRITGLPMCKLIMVKLGIGLACWNPKI